MPRVSQRSEAAAASARAKLNSRSSLSSNAASAGNPERSAAQGSRLSTAQESVLDAEAGEAGDIKNQRSWEGRWPTI